MRSPCELPECPYCPECGLGSHRDFGGRVQQFLDEEEIVQEGLAHEGQRIVDQMCSAHGSMSLRELARRTQLSPTYLSQVRNGHSIISAHAFLRVWAEWKAANRREIS